MVRLQIPEVCLSRHEECFSRPLMGALRVLASSVRCLRISGRTVPVLARSRVARAYFRELLQVCDDYGFDIPTALPWQIDMLVKADDTFCAIHRNWRRVSKRTAKFLTAKTTDKTQKDVFKVLQDLFDYGKFCKGKRWSLSGDCISIEGTPNEKAWSVAVFQKDVVEANHLRFCPYCNSETTFYLSGISTSAGLSRSALDHYYPRIACPYLGVSLYNLVPSCTHCNSSLKNTKVPFDGVDRCWTHPYADNFYDEIRFRFADLDIRHLYGIPPSNLSLEYKGRAKGILAKRLADDLSLKSIYEQAYSHEIRELPMRYQGMLSYAPTLLTDLSSSTSRDVRVFFNSSLDLDRINEERLSKLTIDLINQLRGL